MLERAKKATNGDGYLHIEYARWADDCVILVDGHQKWDWLEKAAYKRLKEELHKLKVELNIEKRLFRNSCGMRIFSSIELRLAV